MIRTADVTDWDEIADLLRASYALAQKPKAQKPKAKPNQRPKAKPKKRSPRR